MATPSQRPVPATKPIPIVTQKKHVDGALPAPTLSRQGVKSRRKRRSRCVAPFRPARQIRLTWLLAVACCASFALTVFYAFSTSFLLRTPWITSSPSNTILVIRALSAVTELLMVGLVAGCFERAKWMLVVSKRGSSLLSFLALSEGIGAWGLFTVVRARMRRIMTARLLAILRALGMIVAPALGVLLLSQVDVARIYVGSDKFPVAAGIGEFKPEYAQNSDIRLISATVFASDFGSLLTNPKVSYPIDPVGSSGSNCLNGGGGISGDCISSYYVSGGLDLVTPWPVLNYSQPEVSLYTVWKSQGLQLEFTSLGSSAVFEGVRDCSLYGGETDAVLICIAAGADNALNMKWLPCPLEESTESACLTSSAWQASTGLSASLRAYRRVATVHYHRSNLSIAAVEDLETPRPLTLSAADYSAIYNSTFQPSGTGAEISTGRQFVTYLHTYLLFAPASNSTQSSVLGQLRNLAASPLYYFQPNYLKPDLHPSPNYPAAGLPSELYTTASMSSSIYRLAVSRGTLLAYTILGSVILALCLAILVAGSLTMVAGSIPETTPFPTLDIPVNCTDGGQQNRLYEKLQECRDLKGRELIRRLEEIQLRPVSEEHNQGVKPHLAAA